MLSSSLSTHWADLAGWLHLEDIEQRPTSSLFLAAFPACLCARMAAMPEVAAALCRSTSEGSCRELL